MPRTTIKLPLPVKGVNRNWPRSDQPPDTAWDAMNILPFDRWGRLRLALRAGAGKAEELAAGNDVRLLHIASVAVSASLPGDAEDNLFPVNVVRPQSTVALGTGTTVLAIYLGKAVSAHTDSQLMFEMTSSGPTSVTWAEVAIATGAFPTDHSAPVLTTRGFADISSLITPGVAANTFTVDIPLAGVNIDDGLWAIIGRSGGVGTLSVRASDILANASPLLRQFGPETTTQPSAISGTTMSFGSTLDFPFMSVRFAGGGDLSRTALKLIAVSGTETYIGEPTDMGAVANTASFPIDANSLFVSAATVFGHTYIVDGTNIRKLDVSTELFEVFTASAGSLPTGTTLAVNWRGRLVLSGSTADPQNVFASRVGDPSDWDFAEEDPAAAWALNAAAAGRVGAPILAMVPLSDDNLLLASENSIYVIRGDVTDGGSVDNVSDTAGIVQANAWCRSADGALYFVGQNGLYRANADGSNPIEVSQDKYRQFFRDLDRSTNIITLTFDPTRYGVWIFVTPLDLGDAPATSLFFDVRNEGFWPIEFTNLPVVGPTAAVFWDGFGTDDRYPVLGAYDGSLYLLQFTNRRDTDGVDNQLISGYLVLGPFQADPVRDVIVTSLDITGGEVFTGDDASVWHLLWTVKGGQSAYAVTEGSPLQVGEAPIHTATGQITVDKRNTRKVTRVRGNWFSVRIGNESNDGDYFSLEQVTVGFIPAGQVRRPG